EVAARFPVMAQHLSAAKNLDLIFAGPRSRLAQLVHNHLYHFVGVTPAGRFFEALGCAPRQQVVTHAADMPPRMPQRNRHARSEQGADAGLLVAEIKLAGLQKNLQYVARCFHRLWSMASGKWKARWS